jgi:hypothetical protein
MFHRNHFGVRQRGMSESEMSKSEMSKSEMSEQQARIDKSFLILVVIRNIFAETNPAVVNGLKEFHLFPKLPLELRFLERYYNYRLDLSRFLSKARKQRLPYITTTNSRCLGRIQKDVWSYQIRGSGAKDCIALPA